MSEIRTAGSERPAGMKLYDFCSRVLFPAILLLYPLRHINVGAEWWDTGYNYGNFMYMDRMDPMWVFGTYLGNALGNLFTRLPFGNYMMGLNVYTGLLVSLLALSGYFFFTKKVKVPAWCAFLGELLAVSLCWCPTALLYNYLTYVLFGGGVAALYCALTSEKADKAGWLFVLAGACLGINVFVRFPNLAQMALILGVWAYGIIKKRSFRQVAAQTGWCVLGYGAGILLMLGYFAARYGLDSYVDAIARLLSMPSEASDYTVASMIIYQLRNYLQNLLWLRYLLVFALLGVLGFLVFPGRFLKVKRVGYIVCVFAGFYYLMMQNMFNMKYSTKLSVFQWAVFLLTATIIIGAVTIFRKKAQDRDKLLLGLGILVILVTPLGSNNHLYSSINNLFFVAPFTLWMLAGFLKWLPSSVALKLPRSAVLECGGGIRITMFPVKAVILCTLFMITLQSIGFGFGYVFSESDGGENLHTKIENNDILRGMKTSPERAEVLESLSAYVQDNGLSGREVILYGQIPSLSYYLQMPFAITSWPDLRSYNYGVMEEDLQSLSEDIQNGSREIPVLLLEVKYGAFAEGGEEALRLLGLEEAAVNAISKDEKFNLLMDWADQYSYETVFKNDKFVLLRAGSAEMR